MTLDDLESCTIGDRVVDRNGVNWEKVDFGSDDEWENDIATVDELKRNGYDCFFATSGYLWNRFEPIRRV